MSCCEYAPSLLEHYITLHHCTGGLSEPVNKLLQEETEYDINFESSEVLLYTQSLHVHTYMYLLNCSRFSHCTTWI